MALTIADLRMAFGRDIRERLRHSLVMTNLVNTEFRGDIQQNYTVDIVSPQEDMSGSTKTDATTAEVARNAVFSNPVQLLSEKKTLTADQASQLGIELGRDDLRDSPFDMRADARQRIARRMAYEIDENLTAYMVASIPGSLGGTNLQKPSAKGSASDYIPKNSGIPSTAAARELVPDAFEYALNWAQGANIITPGEINHQLWCVCNPDIIGAMRNYIRNQKPSDSLVETWGFAPGSIQGLEANPPRLRDNVAGIQVFVNPNMPTTVLSSKDHHTILFGTRQYVTFASRDIDFSFQPQDLYIPGGSSGELHHGYVRFGRLAVNTEQVMQYLIRAEA